MRVLLVLAVVLIGVWLWRSNRETANGQRQRHRQSPPGTKALETVACDWCGVHVETGQAVAGHHGHYCCDDHRQRAEP